MLNEGFITLMSHNMPMCSVLSTEGCEEGWAECVVYDANGVEVQKFEVRIGSLADQLIDFDSLSAKNKKEHLNGVERGCEYES